MLNNKTCASCKYFIGKTEEGCFNECTHKKAVKTVRNPITKKPVKVQKFCIEMIRDEELCGYEMRLYEERV